MFAGLLDDPDQINSMLPRYLAITAEEIRDAARAVFRADNRVVVTYVPVTSGDTTEEASGDATDDTTDETTDDTTGDTDDEEAA